MKIKLRFKISTFLSDETITVGKSKLRTTITSGKEWIYKFVIVILTAAVLLYASVFMYGSFYFAFIPLVAHEVIQLKDLTRDQSLMA